MKQYPAKFLNKDGKPVSEGMVYEIGEGHSKIIYTIINSKIHFGSPAKWEERNEGA